MSDGSLRFGLPHPEVPIGGTLNLGGPSIPLFLDFGWLGDDGRNKQFAPGDFNHNGPYVGLGIHF